MFAALKKLWEECDDDELQCAASNFVTSVGSHSADIMDGDDVDMMIEKYLSGKEPTLMGKAQAWKSFEAYAMIVVDPVD